MGRSKSVLKDYTGSKFVDMPRVPGAETMPERTSGDASGERLTAGDYL